MSNKWLTAAVAVVGIGLVVNFLWTNRNQGDRASLTEGGVINPGLWWYDNTLQLQGAYVAPRMYTKYPTPGNPSELWYQGGRSVVTNSTGRWAA